LETAVREFVAHYHSERNHQGIGNLLIFPHHSLADRGGPVGCRSRLGGMLNYYDRAA
jgi:putative transposase